MAQNGLDDEQNIRLGRQDEIQVVSLMSQQRCDFHRCKRSHKAVQRLAAASMCYCRRDLIKSWPLEGGAAVDTRLPLPFSYFFCLTGIPPVPDTADAAGHSVDWIVRSNHKWASALDQHGRKGRREACRGLDQVATSPRSGAASSKLPAFY